MIDLIDLCSLPIYFNDKDSKIVFGDNVLHDLDNTIYLTNLRPALLNKSLVYPVEVYEESQNVRLSNHDGLIGDDLEYDLILLPEGLLGIEYIKSHIFYSGADTAGQISCLVEVLLGKLCIILQKNGDFNNYTSELQVEQGLYVELEEGQKAVIQKGYYYTFINISSAPVIFARAYSQKGIADYSTLRDKGMAYFCIRKNARAEIVKNPKYRNVPEITRISPMDTFEQYDSICQHQPLYNQIAASINMFLDLLLG
mgnify:CR=1 FL=1